MSLTREGEPRWPQIGDYDDHVANLTLRQLLKNPSFGEMQVERNPGSGSPKVRCGNFGGVYKLLSPASNIALKLFTSREPARELRYRLIHDYLQSQSDCPYLVGFDYENDGMLCNGHRWPMLAMDWIDGERLDLHIHRILKTPGPFPNGEFCRRWVSLVRDLDRRGIAHGDFQSGNILVLADGSFKLVDYDGMFVPTMNGVLAETPELGMPAFQHPRRVRDFFDQRLDYFSALVILLTFACLDTDLWRQFNGGKDDQCLLFRASDFQDPDQSTLFGLLVQSVDPVVRKLAVLLRTACQEGLPEVPAFSMVARDAVVAQALQPGWRPAYDAPTRSRRPPPPPPVPSPLSMHCTRCGALLELRPGKGWQCPACVGAGTPTADISKLRVFRETRVLHSKGPLRSVSLSADGRLALACGFESTVVSPSSLNLGGARLWDLSSGRELRHLSSWVGDSCAVFSPDGQSALTGFLHMIRLWNVASGKEIRQFKSDQGWITNVAFTPDGRRIIAGDEKSVRVFDLKGRELFHFPEREHHTRLLDKVQAAFLAKQVPSEFGTSAAVTPDGQQLLLHLPHGVRLYDLRTGIELANFDSRGGPQSPPTCRLAISRDGASALIGANRSLAVWDLQNIRLIREFHAPGGIRAAAFSAEGDYVCAGGGDHLIHISDIGTGIEMARMVGHTGPIEDLAISPDGHWVLSGSHDHTIRLWSLAA